MVVPAPPQADTLLKKDSLAHRDTVPRVRRDTIQPPIARAEAPQLLGIGGVMRYDRAALFATGMLTVADLLDRIPGTSTMRAGWIAAPIAGTWLGAPRRIRIFYDGVELDAIDPTTGLTMQVVFWQ